jgi:hypothetical protein
VLSTLFFRWQNLYCRRGLRYEAVQAAFTAAEHKILREELWYFAASLEDKGPIIERRIEPLIAIGRYARPRQIRPAALPAADPPISRGFLAIASCRRFLRRCSRAARGNSDDPDPAHGNRRAVVSDAAADPYPQQMRYRARTTANKTSCAIFFTPAPPGCKAARARVCHRGGAHVPHFQIFSS